MYSLRKKLPLFEEVITMFWFIGNASTRVAKSVRLFITILYIYTPQIYHKNVWFETELRLISNCF